MQKFYLSYPGNIMYIEYADGNTYLCFSSILLYLCSSKFELKHAGMKILNKKNLLSCNYEIGLCPLESAKGRSIDSPMAASNLLFAFSSKS